jgi:hypothetical protein
MTISKVLICDENGNVFSEDNRVFSHLKEFTLASIKQAAKEEILSRYPEFKQRNLSMGILTAEEEREIRNGIESIRLYAHSLEDRVLAVQWNGQESTRVAACDEISSISWNYAVEAPPAPVRYTSYEFLLRFTPQERAAFRAAAMTDPLVADFQQLATAAQQVISNDPNTVAGMNYLVSVGLLAQQRANEILGVSEK